MENTKKRWVVAYTRPKWEKKVNQLMQQQHLEVFCPLVKTVKRWSDRNKIVELPLFSSYVFAHVSQREELQVLQTSGVLHLVQHCGIPAVIENKEIQQIKSLVNSGHYNDVERVDIDHFAIGDRIRVKEGILHDWQGEVITINGKSVVMVLQQFNCALIAKVNINQDNLLPV